jgi:hypothetical protein
MSVLCDSICRVQAYMRAKFDIIRLCMCVQLLGRSLFVAFLTIG